MSLSVLKKLLAQSTLPTRQRASSTTETLSVATKTCVYGALFTTTVIAQYISAQMVTPEKQIAPWMAYKR